MKTILTVKQVAELLQVSIPQVRRMIANGELSAMKVGRSGVCRRQRSKSCSSVSCCDRGCSCCR